jgi:hypothetical protein
MWGSFDVRGGAAAIPRSRQAAGEIIDRGDDALMNGGSDAQIGEVREHRR